MPGMKALLKKRDELRNTITQARADLRTIEAAIRLIDPDTGPVRLFERGKLKQMVCEAMREGHEGNHAIALEVITRMGWGATDERVKDVSRRVKDVTKTFK